MSKKRTPKVGDLIEVYWWDHSSWNQWQDKGTTHEPIECRSVGWVDRIDATIIQLYSDDTDCGRVLRQCLRLRNCITRINILKRATAAAPKWTKK